MHSKFCALFAFIAIALAQNGTFPTDGPFYINSVSNSDLRVDVTDASKEARANLTLSSASNTATSQVWSYNQTSRYLTNYNTGNNQIVVTAVDGVGLPLTQDDADASNPNQEWVYNQEVIALYQNPEMCMTVQDNNLVMDDCNGADAQKWTFSTGQ